MTDAYMKYLKDKNKLELRNAKQLTIHHKTAKNAITPEQAQEELNQLYLNDTPLNINDAREELRKNLEKYIKSGFYLDKIVNSPKLSEEILNQLVVNFETMVEDKLKRLSGNKNISVEKIILLLENIGKSIISNSLGIDVRNQLGDVNNNLINLQNNNNDNNDNDDVDAVNEDDDYLKNEIISYNKQKYQEQNIVYEIANIKSIKKNDLYPIIFQIFMIDRCISNFLLVCSEMYIKLDKRRITKSSGFANKMDIIELNDALKLKTKTKSVDEVRGFVIKYYQQTLTYNNISPDEISDVFNNRNDVFNNNNNNLDTSYVSNVGDDESDEEYMVNKITPNPSRPVAKSSSQANVKEDDDDNESEDKTGTGLKVKKPKHLRKNEKMIHHKYFIDMKKLGGSVLDIRYTKNRHMIPIKQQVLSGPMKGMVEKLVGGEIDRNNYGKLTNIDKHLYRSLLKYFDQDPNDINDEDAFHDRFEVIKGEIASGNDNASLKKEAKAYLVHAMQIGMINRNTFNTLIVELDL